MSEDTSNNHKLLSRRPPMGRMALTCFTCGKAFEKQINALRRKNFCSLQCAVDGRLKPEERLPKLLASENPNVMPWEYEEEDRKAQEYLARELEKLHAAHPEIRERHEAREARYIKVSFLRTPVTGFNGVGDDGD